MGICRIPIAMIAVVFVGAYEICLIFVHYVPCTWAPTHTESSQMGKLKMLGTWNISGTSKPMWYIYTNVKQTGMIFCNSSANLLPICMFCLQSSFSVILLCRHILLGIFPANASNAEPVQNSNLRSHGQFEGHYTLKPFPYNSRTTNLQNFYAIKFYWFLKTMGKRN